MIQKNRGLPSPRPSAAQPSLPAGAGAAIAFGFIAWGGVILPPPPPSGRAWSPPARTGAAAGGAFRIVEAVAVNGFGGDEGPAAGARTPRGDLPARRFRKHLRGLFVDVWA